MDLPARAGAGVGSGASTGFGAGSGGAAATGAAVLAAGAEGAGVTTGAGIGVRVPALRGVAAAAGVPGMTVGAADGTVGELIVVPVLAAGLAATGLAPELARSLLGVAPAAATLLGVAAIRLAAPLLAAATGPAAGLLAAGIAVTVLAAGLAAAAGLTAALLAAGLAALGSALDAGREPAIGSFESTDATGAVDPAPPLTAGARAGSATAAGGRVIGRPDGGTKLVERMVVFASEVGRTGSLAPPGRAGAVNTVDRAGSSARGRACAGGGAEPGRIVAFSIPPVGPAAGRGSSFGPRACGATGDPARMVSCNRPELGRGVDDLSRAGGVGG
ncbi:MAG: hypothetical protein H0T76_09215, partial [Nannocystis sp.]|nr:hypothetical protein [Nannocystis sp.]